MIAIFGTTAAESQPTSIADAIIAVAVIALIGFVAWLFYKFLSGD